MEFGQTMKCVGKKYLPTLVKENSNIAIYTFWGMITITPANIDK
jgi:hypothetical protein